MKRFYKFIPLLILLLPLAGAQAIAVDQQQTQPTQGQADGLTPQQREQQVQQMRQQQEKMQAEHEQMLREANAQRLKEEIKSNREVAE